MIRGYCNGGSPSIEQCLNCPYDDCKYDYFDHTEPKKDRRREYLIKRILRAKNGNVKVSYVSSYTTKRADSSAVIENAMRLTEKEAKEAIKAVRGLVSDRTDLIIVKRSEEIERINSGEV